MNNLKNITCCYTGHRNLPKTKIKQIHDLTMQETERLISQGYRRFYTGGALGFDTVAAIVILKLKNRYPDIKLNLALPCSSQTKGWKASDVELYENIKKSADEVYYISDEYTSSCMLDRNRYLVDNSSVCIAWLSSFRGGTVYTVNYAKRNNLEIINIADMI